MRQRKVWCTLKRLVRTLAPVMLLVFVGESAHAITVTSATLSDGTVTVDGNKAAKSAAIFWESVAVATSTPGGAFTFTTAAVPAGCVGTLSDGVSTVDVAISGCPEVPPPTTAFPATGQTTCWDSAGTAVACAGTGQDGDVQAGAPLSYTDNGDGTITDNNTGLMWAKKSDDGSILHDQHNTYTWSDAFAVHIAGLNTAACFAGHCDWRLPNVKELQSIVNYENVNPAVSSAFNTCGPGVSVVSGSCTAPSVYWSSSSFAGFPTLGWGVAFNVGFVFAPEKSINFHVRAVRGGS